MTFDGPTCTPPGEYATIVPMTNQPTKMLRGVSTPKIIMRSKFESMCWICHAKIRVGDSIEYSPNFRSAKHETCSPREVRQRPHGI